ncbi:metallophosphoesterase family protein [Candidatus Woesearchaeota archaeon]|nr:metallophosphoesterase family protein [Candidatus Woesearchaeota archaeon]
MRLLVFTDVHGDERIIKRLKKKAKKTDLVLCAGDITIFEHNMRRILQELNRIGKPLLLVHGNHEGESNLRKACKQHKNIVFLHKRFYEQEGVLIVGYGGGGFALRDKEFERFEKRIRAKRKKDQKLVVMFHGPPYKLKVDRIMGEHAGSKSYTDFIKKQKPKIVICGHLHENNYKHDKIGKTIILNPGPEGRIITIK